MARKADRKALGRGLSALLGDAAASGALATSGGRPQPAADTNEIPIDLIQSNPDQPRRTFREEDLAELAASIKEHGVLQPVLLRPLKGKSNQYQIVAGERRWRAAQKVGLKEIEAVISDIAEQDTLTVALVENVQRRDLR